MNLEALLDELADKVAERVLSRLQPAISTAPLGLLDVEEAAARLGVSVSTVYHKALEGLIPSVKQGSRRMFDPKDLDTYVERLKMSKQKVVDIAAAQQARVST